jgi:hypothetical protein
MQIENGKEREMKRQLLLATEFSFRNTEKLSRLELWSGAGFALEEWTCIGRNDNWARIERVLHAGDLESAVESYGWFIFQRAILGPRATLRGVAVCLGVPNSIKGPLMLEAHRIIREVWEFCDTFPTEHVPILLYAFIGEFGTRLPRGVIGDGCWAVQFKGLRACGSCPYEKHVLCPGRSIVRTGYNSAGMLIPVLNCIAGS